MFLRQILSCYNLKIFFSKLVKVLVLVLELYYGTRTRVHFSISVLVLEVFCGTRTRKLSSRFHHCILLALHFDCCYFVASIRDGIDWSSCVTLTYFPLFEVVGWSRSGKGGEGGKACQC